MVHSVTDISHEFSFYFDGRFAQNYLNSEGDTDARNWATLHKLNLSCCNLLVLQSGGTPCEYLPQDIAAVERFLAAGGGVVLFGEFARFRDQSTYALNRMADTFGARFVDAFAKKPLNFSAALNVQQIESYDGKVIRLAEPDLWERLIVDANGEVIMARRSIGTGQLLVSSRSIIGRQPDAKDPINAEIWQPLLRSMSRHKAVDPRLRPAHAMPENRIERGGLCIECSDYLMPMAELIFGVFGRARPVLEQIFGVPPPSGALAGLILLPTNGGGFSSGSKLGLGVWWGGFPDREYGMIELLGHEATHSWVHPFPEPMWDEAIATYIGIQLGKSLGYENEATASLNDWLARARHHDLQMSRFDLSADEIPHDVRMGKSMWVLEQLRSRRPDLIAEYFRKKRDLIDPASRKRYSADDCVAILSLAMGDDLFAWFRSFGTDVDRSRTDIRLP